MDGGSVDTGAQRVPSESTATQASRIMIQNGSFFYPRRAGFRNTAVYSAGLGERNLKKYIHGPGGEITLSLGSDKGPRNSTVRSAFVKSANPVERERAERMKAAGTSSLAEREKLARPPSSRRAPPGGKANVVLGTDKDENPSSEQHAMLAAATDPAYAEVASKATAAGYGSKERNEQPSRPAKTLKQNIGGDDNVLLGSDVASYPKASLMADDMALAHNPVLKSAAEHLPVQGVVVPRFAPEPRRRFVKALQGDCMKEVLAQDTEPVAKTSLWEDDVSRSLQEAARMDASEYPAAGSRVSEKPTSLRVLHGTGGDSSLHITYAMERDNASAAASPVRARHLPRHAPRTHCSLKRISSVEAAGCVGPSMISGAGGSAPDMYRSTTQVAWAGERTHDAPQRRPMVKRVQNVGGRTTVSLCDAPDAAGIRTVMDAATNPITALPPNPITAPPPPAIRTGRRFLNPQPCPDQVAITSADVERLRHRDARRMSVRSLAPPGGVATVSIQ